MNVSYLVTMGTLIWLLLLITSILFPPKGGAMRLTEKVLMLLSALLATVWIYTLLMSPAATA
jgi:hypothetical protein